MRDWNLNQEEQADPRDSESLDEWLCGTLGPATTVMESKPLIGGIGSTVSRLKVQDGSGDTKFLVLRLFPTERLGQEQLEKALRHETTVLEFLNGHSTSLDVSCPRLIAADIEGHRLGTPAMLCSWIPGQVAIMPTDTKVWAEDLARPLPQFHRLNPESASSRLHTAHPGPVRNPPTPPTWTDEMDNKTRDAWDAVLAAIDEGIPEADLVFLHGDYHPTNVIWDDNNIKGVIDWSLSHVGPVGLELGHCRINLVCMYGLEVANYFLEAYRQIGHEDSRDDKLQARCDAIRCWMFPFLYPPWPQLGKTDLTEKIIQVRLDEYAGDISRRLR